MDDPAFSTASTVDPNTQIILLHASAHDIPSLKPFLRIPGNASVQDPETGYTPLHAAIAACGEYIASKLRSIENSQDLGDQGAAEEEEVDLEKAKATVRELFLSGAIWNDLDANDETPGCLAWRLGWRDLYELCVEAGVRAEVLLGLMGGYEELDSDDDDADEVEEQATTEEITDTNGQSDSNNEKPKRDVNSKDYLSSSLTLTSNGNLLDSDNNGVMMTWETSIMQESVSRLLPPANIEQPLQGKRILNIGFGLGIIDGMFAATNPQTHHIIEAHPDVLSSLELPTSKFGKAWEESAPESGRYKVFGGKWQTVVPELLEKGEKYDAIYFDTFGESYSQLRLFFQEYVPDLLVQSDKESGIEGGRFGFFNGLGADRRVCYDVYTNVVEIDSQEVGMEVEWFDVLVSEEVSGKREGEGEWEGVRRRYWVLDTYRLPILRLVDGDP